MLSLLTLSVIMAFRVSATSAFVQNAVGPAAPGAIRGVVTKAGTVETLSRVVLELRADDEQAASIPTTTDESGWFEFRSVPSGRYRIMASRSGYGSRPLTVTVSGGRTEDVAVSMTPTGAVSGRVYGQQGEPLGNIQVSALKSSHQNGRRVWTEVQSVPTNDLGEYRLFWLPPGRYVIRATHPLAQTGVLAPDGPGRMAAGFQMTFGFVGGLGPNGIIAARGSGDSTLFDAFGPGGDSSERYVPVYFPGTTDDQGAATLDLRAGADLGAIDVPVTPVRSRHVRGVVIDGATGQVARYAALTEVHPGSMPGEIGGVSGGLSNNGRNPIDPEGAFDVTLLPGRHTLMGTAGTGVGVVSLEVRDADLDGIRIVAMPAFNLTGRIVTDAPIERADLTNVRISLWRDLSAPTRSPSYSMPRADGSFVLSATPGDYFVNIAPFLDPTGALRRFMAPLPSGFENAYVKSIRLGETDVLAGGLHLEGPTSSSLEVVVGMNPGSIEGTVQTETGAAAVGATVVLLPDTRSRFDLVRTATAGPSGLFRMDRVAPGNYRLFAWSDPVEDDWLDPDAMRTFEQRGAAIPVTDGMTARAVLTAIR